MVYTGRQFLEKRENGEKLSQDFVGSCRACLSPVYLGHPRKKEGDDVYHESCYSDLEFGKEIDEHPVGFEVRHAVGDNLDDADFSVLNENLKIEKDYFGGTD